MSLSIANTSSADERTDSTNGVVFGCVETLIEGQLPIDFR